MLLVPGKFFKPESGTETLLMQTVGIRDVVLGSGACVAWMRGGGGEFTPAFERGLRENHPLPQWHRLAFGHLERGRDFGQGELLCQAGEGLQPVVKSLFRARLIPANREVRRWRPC